MPHDLICLLPFSHPRANLLLAGTPQTCSLISRLISSSESSIISLSSQLTSPCLFSSPGMIIHSQKGLIQYQESGRPVSELISVSLSSFRTTSPKVPGCQLNKCMFSGSAILMAKLPTIPHLHHVVCFQYYSIFL